MPGASHPLVRPASDNGGYHYLHTDHLGTPSMATDKTGAITWKAVSEAFGASRAVESDVQVNLRFPGQYWDQESGRHYSYHRDYESNTGRYLQGDPIGLKGGVNRYIYAEGSPLVYMDSMGLQTTLNWCLKILRMQQRAMRQVFSRSPLEYRLLLFSLMIAMNCVKRRL